MDLRSELLARGLTPQQANSKAVEAVESILAKNSGVGFDTVSKMVEETEKKADKIGVRMGNVMVHLENYERRINKLESKVTAYEEGVSKEIVTDPKLLDTLNFYTALLSRTQAVFGAEKMTEPVIIKLLETASYGIWRSIMGGKFESEAEYTDYTQKKAGRRL
jgi:hypothetical protein